MKLLSLCLLTVVALCGCSNRHALKVISAERFTDSSPGKYRYESGMLSKDGFIPAGNVECDYRSDRVSRAEVQAVDGKPVVQLAAWILHEGHQGHFRRSKETVMIHQVPYVFVEP